MTSTEALSAVWPTGIPPQDYGRLLKLVEALGRPAAPQPRNVVLPATEPKMSEKKRAVYARASNGQIARVMELLRTGPATANDISKASGISGPAVYAALRHGGAVVVGHMKRPSGHGRGSNLWALPASK